ncbi:DNA polymerase III, beta subunit [Desulfobulbus propionicus DSM 2032]|uniref:Beta sliding clamp n=1 Tax=Desulfobulbus propionicus (strain ATCC 33891 / DSM 2032 / VKM B-1956 / 1pr3) TaxID=577650 RepID=A0A7U4DQU6_DESPD|nr:DNA polymerase III subunit beta [Desulfobulbus propionicus]ADW19417.1 DNA polymerase III, beta subunit [Desulfobulbus propionicus DSM 2032]
MAFHFNIGRDDLLKAIGAQQNITNKKGTLAILSNVLLEVQPDHIVLTGTDLEIGLKQRVPAEVLETGTLTLPAKKLFEVARESGSSILSLKELDNNWVEISAGPSLYRLAGMVADEFPSFPAYNEEAMVIMESVILADLVDKTVFSIAQDKENMFTLTAAMLQKVMQDDHVMLKMVTSDGHRLTIMSKEVETSLEQLHLNPITLIPRRGVQEIRKFCENKTSLSFGVEEKQAVLKSDDSLLIIRLMEGDFPDFQGLLSVLSKENSIRIDRIRFLESLKRINLFTEDLFHAIKMDIADNTMVLTSQNADFGSAKDEFNVEYSGPPLTLGFNCRYFIETLQVMEGDVITASINTQESPCMITSDEDKGFLSIIMPMKL